MNNCIFCKIVAHEIPATIIHEDDDVLVFMDIGPIIKGHALVIP
ncbi:MAG: HIT domain-containing protein, partial [Pontiella sp.]|nr:HIT domain-containing protein [Pontiella sp.]